MLPLRCLVIRTRPAVVTAILVALNGLMFVFELWLGKDVVPLIRTFGFVPAEFTYGMLQHDMTEWVPAFTSLFLHSGWLHLAGNMLFLWVFGSGVEDRLGPGRYLALYFAAGAAAAVADTLATPWSPMPMIGASGAVAGVLGAYLFLFPQSRVRSLVFAVVVLFVWDVPAAAFLLVWFALQLFSGAASMEASRELYGGVAYFAHVGGFLVGCVLAFVLRSSVPYRPVYAWRGAFGRPYYTR